MEFGGKDVRAIPRNLAILFSVILLIISSAGAIYYTLSSATRIVNQLTNLSQEVESFMLKFDNLQNRIKYLESMLQENFGDISSLTLNSTLKYEELLQYLDIFLSNKLYNITQLSIIPKYQIPIFFEATELTFDFTLVISPIEYISSQNSDNSPNSGGM